MLFSADDSCIDASTGSEGEQGGLLKHGIPARFHLLRDIYDNIIVIPNLSLHEAMV